MQANILTYQIKLNLKEKGSYISLDTVTNMNFLKEETLEEGRQILHSVCTEGKIFTWTQKATVLNVVLTNPVNIYKNMLELNILGFYFV